MNDREYFQTTSLSYQLQAARRELAGFRSGEAYQKLRADYEGIIREKNLAIKKLQKERDGISFPAGRSRSSGWTCWKMSRKSMKKKQKS